MGTIGKNKRHVIHGTRATRHYLVPELEPVLKETYGRILFQDQNLDVAKIVGRFTPDHPRRGRHLA